MRKALHVSGNLKPGVECEVVFYANPKSDSRFRFRATHVDGKRAPKVILCDDPRIQPGQLCRVRVISVRKPASKERGYIEVEFLSQVTFRLDDSLYVEPLLRISRLPSRGEGWESETF